MRADKKKPVEKWDTYLVQTSCKSSIINTANTKKDELGQTIQGCLLNVIDLVSAAARYHNSCYRNIFKFPTSNKRSCPKDEQLSFASGHLYMFLQKITNDKILLRSSSRSLKSRWYQSMLVTVSLSHLFIERNLRYIPWILVSRS